MYLMQIYLITCPIMQRKAARWLYRPELTTREQRCLTDFIRQSVNLYNISPPWFSTDLWASTDACSTCEDLSVDRSHSVRRSDHIIVSVLQPCSCLQWCEWSCWSRSSGRWWSLVHSVRKGKDQILHKVLHLSMKVCKMSTCTDVMCWQHLCPLA